MISPAAWLEAACADADRRGLGELKPLLEALARSTAALRAADKDYRAHPEDHPSRGDRRRLP
jgi:hypothetical protein